MLGLRVKTIRCHRALADPGIPGRRDPTGPNCCLAFPNDAVRAFQQATHESGNRHSRRQAPTASERPKPSRPLAWRMAGLTQ